MVEPRDRLLKFARLKTFQRNPAKKREEITEPAASRARGGAAFGGEQFRQGGISAGLEKEKKICAAKGEKTLHSEKGREPSRRFGEANSRGKFKGKGALKR